MIILPQLYQHCNQDIKNALNHLHYGLGRMYKIQIYKGFDHEVYGHAVTSGDAVMFTIQQMFGSAHLRQNNDIIQVKEWFNQTTQNIDIHVVDNKKYDIFVIAKRNLKPAVEPVIEPVIELSPEPEPEWTAIDATGLAETKSDEESI